MSTILWLFGIRSKLESWKSSISGYLRSWPPAPPKNHCFEVLFSLILFNNNEPFLSWIVICDEKWILYDNQLYQLSGWIETKLQSTSQSLICTEKRSWSLFGGLLPISDPLQLSESWWNHYIWEICPANRCDVPKTAMPATDIGQKKGPNSLPGQHPTTCCTANTSKVEQTGLWSFASSAIFIWPLVIWLPLLKETQKLFAGKMLPQPVWGRKCFARVHRILKHRFFTLLLLLLLNCFSRVQLCATP